MNDVLPIFSPAPAEFFVARTPLREDNAGNQAPGIES
jgi:hypothetical protein